MYENEYLYFSNYEYLRSKEKNEIFDPYEGTSKIIHIPKDSMLNLRNENFNIDLKLTKNTHIREFHKDLSKFNILSLFYINSRGIKKDGTVNLSKKIVSFQEWKYCMIIYNIGDFLQKFNNSMREIGRNYYMSPIKYYSPHKFDGDIDPFFNKPNEYNHQKEFRLVIENPEENVFLKIPIKNFKENLFILETESIFNGRFKIMK